MSSTLNMGDAQKEGLPGSVSVIAQKDYKLNYRISAISERLRWLNLIRGVVNFLFATHSHVSRKA